MIIPYITFNGNCLEALKFYKEVFDTDEPQILNYGNYIPEELEIAPQNLSEWIMHAEVKICGSMFWFADDVKKVTNGGMLKLTITVPSSVDARNLFERLNDCAQIELPPTETFYSTFHAALTDKYGVSWNIVANESPKK